MLFIAGNLLFDFIIRRLRIVPPEFVQTLGKGDIFLRIKVGIYIPGQLYRSMAKPPGDFHDIHTHVHEEGCMGVPEIMHPYLREPRQFCDTMDLLLDTAFGEIEDSLIRLITVKAVNILLQLIVKEIRDRYGSYACLIFGSKECLEAIHNGEVLVDVDPL